MIRYLFDDWNKFDCVVAVVSIVGLFVNAGVGVNVVRVFRIARVFRIIKRAKVRRIRPLQTALATRAPFSEKCVVVAPGTRV